MPIEWLTILSGRDDLLHRLRWRWRRRRDLVEVRLMVVTHVVITGRRSRVGSTWERELRNTLVRRPLSAVDWWRFGALGPTAGATHAFSYALECHTEVFAHTATTPSVSVWRSSSRSLSGRNFQGLLAWAVALNGNVDHANAVATAEV